MNKRKSISKQSAIISLRSLLKESDKGCAISVGTFLEMELRLLHEAHITTNTTATTPPTKFFESLTGPYAPLATFAGMIQIAFAYALISQGDYEDLELMRKIRNEAAHSIYDFSFQDSGVRSVVMRLKSEDRVHRVLKMASEKYSASAAAFLKLTDERQWFIRAALALQDILLERTEKTVEHLLAKGRADGGATET